MIKYITVAEYAKRQGITKKQAYAEIKKPQYAELVSHINGILHIAVEEPEPMAAIKEPEPKTAAANEKPSNRQTGSGEETRSGTNTGIDTDTFTKDYIDFLKRQLEESQRTIAEKDAIIAEQNQKLSLLLEQQQDLTKQALQATQQAQYIGAIQSLPEGKKTIWERLRSRRKGSESDNG